MRAAVLHLPALRKSVCLCVVVGRLGGAAETFVVIGLQKQEVATRSRLQTLFSNAINVEKAYAAFESLNSFEELVNVSMKAFGHV